MKKFLLPTILGLAGLGFIFIPNFFSSGSIDLKIQPASVIMPAAYKVYANPDVAGGRYNLFKAVVKNTGSSEIHNFKVQFRVPKYIDDWTDVTAPNDILPGQEAVITCHPVFDQSITQKSTSSREKADIRFLYGSKTNPTERDESFNFNMLSVNDIVYNDMSDSDKVYGNDLYTNMPLYACMVTSEDPIIKYYAQQVQQKVLQGEQAAGVGTAGGVTDDQVKEIIRVMQGVYNATLLTKMVYSETSGGVSTFGDATTTTEHIRLPREVVTGNTGLCIELALLHASVLEAAGDHAVIFLIPGHAFPGVKVGNNVYMAIESTGIGGQGLGGVASAQQAFDRGEAEMDTFFMMRNRGMPGYFLLDIDELNDEGYKQMELKDDQYLRTKVDQLAQSFVGGNMNNFNQMPQQAGDNEMVANNNTPGNTTVAMATHRGLISFQYPASWQQRNRPVPQVPILTTMFTSPGGRHGAVEIYQVPGATSATQALAYIQQTLAKYGVQVRYQGDGEQNGLTRVAGMSQDRTGSYRWEGFLKVVNGGVEAVVVGAGPNASFTSVHQQIMSTIQ